MFGLSALVRALLGRRGFGALNSRRRFSALGLDPRCNLLGIAGRIKTLTTEDLAQAVRQTTHRGAEILAAVTCFRLFGTDSRRSLHLQLHARVVVASADDTDNRVFVLQAVRDTFQLRLGLALVAGRVGTATGGNRLGKHHRLQFRVVRACRTLALVEDRVLQVAGSLFGPPPSFSLAE